MDLSGITAFDRTKGVLFLIVDGSGPQAPLKVDNARIRGLKDTMMRGIENQKIASLQMPVAVRLVLDRWSDIGLVEGTIARNEGGTVFINESPMAYRSGALIEWLHERLHGEGREILAQGDTNHARSTAFEAARIILDDFGRKSVKDLGISVEAW